jgi:hypothetical protein
MKVKCNNSKKCNNDICPHKNIHTHAYLVSQDVDCNKEWYCYVKNIKVTCTEVTK